MEVNLFYFLNQKVEVKADIFWEDFENADSTNYFPTKSKVLSNFYSRVNYPTNGYIDNYEV
jgi:hypothetical protein